MTLFFIGGFIGILAGLTLGFILGYELARLEFTHDPRD